MKPFEILVEDDFFLPEELEMIWHEIYVLSQPEVMCDPDQTGTAREEGLSLKKNKGIFLHKFYADIQSSPIFQYSRKIFEDRTSDFADLCFANKSVLSTTKSTYLLSYYGDGDSYSLHRDSTVTTALYWFCKSPKKFTGGDLYFPEIDEVVEFKNNRMVMFPSWADHEVPEVKLMEGAGDRDGRFCVTQFMVH